MPILLYLFWYAVMAGSLSVARASAAPARDTFADVFAFRR